MKPTTIHEKELRPLNGFAMLFIAIIGLLISTGAFVVSIIFLERGDYTLGASHMIGGVLGWLVFSTLAAGLKIVRPNEARVFTLFGTYHGTLKTPGFHFVNPFCVSFSPTHEAAKAAATSQKTKDSAKQSSTDLALTLGLGSKAISLKTQTLDNKRQKVNDILGNPIIIGAIVIWRVKDPTQVVFAVENYHEYLGIQTDSTIRNTSRLYPYDTFEEDGCDTSDASVKERTLRGSSLEIAETMKDELQKRVEDAGLVIEEVRITHLAYAEEIAAAMLQRQQATAIIAARKKIVDGAVGMVKMAITQLGDDDIVELDEERKAAMVSNLLVVLCGNRDAQPIVNSGSIY
ncbi:MAG: SPFH domain-containing protein [Coriobacteriia bacterium]|nr:SPFH domain-containing protein [Coriobacteriia bacterium]